MPNANTEYGESMSASEIAETLAAMDRILPFEMSDEERAAWDADRQARRDREKTQFEEHAQELQRNWE